MFRPADLWNAKYYLAPPDGSGKHVAIGEHRTIFWFLLWLANCYFASHRLTISTYIKDAGNLL
jgi:hypothetical protein